MKRVKRHKIKHEKPETSSAFTRAMEEHDLAYYIHDRVELMHQVFSVLKPKDLKAMAPECVRRLTIDDLQELCTEELLGISSKRLLAVLDGAEPPSDTESSSQSSEHMEAISLDSISSDEEILSQTSKKKRKHKHRSTSSSKSKKHKAKKPEDLQSDRGQTKETDKEHSKASRAGLTVLELLELQARARAIRAQLQQEQIKKSDAVAVESSHNSSDSEVEIKEEPAEVVEIISSDDEKPQIEKLQEAVQSANKESEEAASATTTAAESTDNTTKTGKTKKKKEKSKKKDKNKEKVKETTVRDKNNDEKDKHKDNNSDKSKDAVEKARENAAGSAAAEDGQKITKRVNDLIITVPQQSTRKIKLNRNKMTVSIPNNSDNDVVAVENTRSISSVVTIPENVDISKKISSVCSRPTTVDSVVKIVEPNKDKIADNDNKVAEKTKSKDKSKKKQKKKEKRQSIDEDHDEITLQLSDSEKMDLLENFDKRNYDDVSSSSSDSESSSSDSSDDSAETQDTCKDLGKSEDKKEASNNTSSAKCHDVVDNVCDNNNEIEVSKPDSEISGHQNVNDERVTGKPGIEQEGSTQDDAVVSASKDVVNKDDENSDGIKDKEASNDSKDSTVVHENDIESTVEKIAVDATKDNSFETSKEVKSPVAAIEDQNVFEISKIDDIPVHNDDTEIRSNASDTDPNMEKSPKNSEGKDKSPKLDNNAKESNSTEESTETKNAANTNEKELSEGELSDQESSEVEACELKPEVVCISDEETPKKKKKKDKKSKKKKSDFRESADQNFYRDAKESHEVKDQVTERERDNEDHKELIILLDEDDEVCEILELSDDSSCYEVEGTTLSKEPTADEIAALSAKIDEIEREEVVTEQEIQMHEKLQEVKENAENSSNEELENISWKDRYLDSKKVRKVLSTSNILNAIRKKNKELKKKIEESKKKEKELEEQKALEEAAKKEPPIEQDNLEEGSIEHYKTLQPLTQYVDPVPDPVELAKKKEEELREQDMREAARLIEQEREVAEAIQSQVTGEMKKDAKQLLKMYKKLLKYNDVTIQKDPNKKKKKKKKKDKGNGNV